MRYERPGRADTAEPDYEAIVVGAGISGIYQLYRLVEAGVRVLALEAAPDLGGTWYANRYPGCRFDSESYTYGYSFSKEVLAEWDWSERFTGQPENLRYLNFVADKFQLRRHMRFNSAVLGATFDDDRSIWRVTTSDGSSLTCRFLITALGQLSVPVRPRLHHIDSFEGPSFHTYDWPSEGIDLRGKRVAVLGTGATGIQVISTIADQVAELTVFQRRPNWCAPLNNSPISRAEMDEIKARYDDIFEVCSRTPGGFMHEPDRRPFFEVPEAERRAFWEKLYAEPGFGIWLANFRDIFVDPDSNAEFSAFMAEKVRQRVHDPVLAEKLIPTDHGFGVQRVPLETRYYEVYNRDNVQLVELFETPIEQVTRTGIRTSMRDYELDVIVYATGFDAITGAYDRIDIRGVGGRALKDKWVNGPVTYLGLASHDFPNLLTVAGPQTASALVNYPRGIETSVDWINKLLDFMSANGHSRVEATPESETWWREQIITAYNNMLLSTGKAWFTGYNSNIEGRDSGKPRYLVYTGGAPKYRKLITEVADQHYQGLLFR